MRTFHRPNRLSAFGLVDAVVGILILALAAMAFSQALGSLRTVFDRQTGRVLSLMEAKDEHSLADHY
jgi:hypothetical protein